MFGRFFDTSAIDQFAATVSGDLRKVLSVELCESDAKAARKARDAAQQRIRRHVDSFATTVRLNIYQKAKLGIRLQEALEAAGYPASFSKTFAYDVVAQVAQSAAGAR
jgi:hypothetical protein